MMATATKTPERELSKQLRETLRLLRQGKTATEIAKKRKVTSAAVYNSYRRLEEAGYGDLLGRNGGTETARSSGDSTPPTPPRAVEVASGIESAMTAVESNRDALSKTVENLDTEAAALRAQADAKAEEANRHREEIAILERMAAVANGKS